MQACRNGHVMTDDEQFCLVCGAPVMGEPDRPDGLLPPFDAERFRDGARGDAAGSPRTVPAWVFVAVIVLGLAAGIVIGAVR